jgi:hypothetical protein
VVCARGGQRRNFEVKTIFMSLAFLEWEG